LRCTARDRVAIDKESLYLLGHAIVEMESRDIEQRCNVIVQN